MPYICLARSDIPKGVVQVLDLQPNASQVIPSQGQGQTRYVNRPQAEPAVLELASGGLAKDAYGVEAYLVDRVEPGAVDVASGTLTAVGPLHGDTVTVAGVVFTATANYATGTAQSTGAQAGDTVTVGATTFNCVEDTATGTALMGAVVAGNTVVVGGVTFTAVNPGPAVPANQEFDDVPASGSDIATAASLVATVNDAASQALIVAANAGASATAVNGGTATVTLTATVPGAQGDLTLAETGAHVTLSGVAMTHTNANAAAGEFNSFAHLGTDILVAGSLAAAVNASAVPVSAANGGTDTVTITADTRGLVGELALAESTAGARLVVSGANLATVAPVAASQEFAALAAVASNAAVATSFRTTLVDAASIALMQAATGGSYATAVAPGAAIVTLTAVDNLGVALPGNTGDLQFLTSNATRLVRSANNILAGTLTRAHGNWTRTILTATATALQARVDAGSAMALSDINTVLAAQAGAELTNAGGSASTGVVLELLSIFAGRGYRAPQYADRTGTLNVYFTGLGLWDATQRGGFTRWVRKSDTNFYAGEFKPTLHGGDWVEQEIAPIRYSAKTAAFMISLATGTLATFGAVAGMPPVTLWPDSDPCPHYPWAFQGTLQYPEVPNARVLTVYDDDGTVLA